MRTVVVEGAVAIRRSPQEVFEYSSDPSHEPEWNPMMKRIVKLGEGPVGIGARYTARFAQGPPMVIECVAYDPPSAWSIIGESRALRAGSSGRVTPVPEGARLTMRMELQPRGLLKLATPLLRRRMRSMWPRDLDKIKAQLEGGGRASG